MEFMCEETSAGYPGGMWQVQSSGLGHLSLGEGGGWKQQHHRELSGGWNRQLG